MRIELAGGVVACTNHREARTLLSQGDGGTVYQAYLVRMPADMTTRLRPQDRPRWPGGARLLSSILSLLVIAAVIYEIRGVHLHAILAMIPSSPAFWTIFAISYLAQPGSEWLIFRRLWGVYRGLPPAEGRGGCAVRSDHPGDGAHRQPRRGGGARSRGG